MAKRIGGYNTFKSLSRALEVAARDSWTSSGKPMVVEYDTLRGVYEVWSKKVRDEVPALKHVVLITTVMSEANLGMDTYHATLGKVKR